MLRMRKTLTKRKLDALRASAVDTFVWDSEVSGFGVKITPPGRKMFLLVYRFPRGRAGRVRRFTIGRYGDITVDQAREVAKAKRGDIARGVDPMATLESERQLAEADKQAPKSSVAAVVAE